MWLSVTTNIGWRTECRLSEQGKINENGNMKGGENAMAKSAKTVTLTRSAISGRFVKPSAAKSHPKTTVTEHRPAKRK
jgi:hypothetical protein